MMNKIRIATVGVGRFGVFHLHAFKQMERMFSIKLAAAAELDANKRLKIENEFNIPVYENYLEMLEKEELDAVSIATRDYQHKEVVLSALSKNLHVLVEKPLDVSSFGALEMVELANKRNCLLQVDFHKRYDPYHIEIKQLAEKNIFGEFLYGYCHMEDQIVVPRDWFSEWAHYTSPVWFLGSNFIDLISWIMGSRVKSVYASGQKNKLLQLGIDTFDSVQSMLTFENNAVITFDSSWILPEQFTAIVNQGFRLIGTEGIVESDSHRRGTSSCFVTEKGTRNLNSGFMQLLEDPYGRKKYEGYGIKSIQHFLENVLHLNNGLKLKDIEGTYPSGFEGYEVTKAVEAIHQSIETGSIVELQKETIYADKL